MCKSLEYHKLQNTKTTQVKCLSLNFDSHQPVSDTIIAKNFHASSGRRTHLHLWFSTLTLRYCCDYSVLQTNFRILFILSNRFFCKCMKVFPYLHKRVRIRRGNANVHVNKLLIIWGLQTSWQWLYLCSLWYLMVWLLM